MSGTLFFFGAYQENKSYEEETTSIGEGETKFQTLLRMINSRIYPTTQDPNKKKHLTEGTKEKGETKQNSVLQAKTEEEERVNPVEPGDGTWNITSSDSSGIPHHEVTKGFPGLKGGIAIQDTSQGEIKDSAKKEGIVKRNQAKARGSGKKEYNDDEARRRQGAGAGLDGKEQGEGAGRQE